MFMWSAGARDTSLQFADLKASGHGRQKAVLGCSGDLGSLLRGRKGLIEGRRNVDMRCLGLV